MERSTQKYIYWLLGAIAVIAAVVAGYQYSRANAMKTSVENNYNRAFHELVDYVDDIDTLLQKSMLVSSPAQAATISSELFRETTAAKACLAQLPISEVQLEKTEKFLSQIGDYTYVLSQKSIYDEEITDEDYKNLESLGTYASELSGELLKMQDDIYNGEITFETLKNEGNKHFSNTANADGGSVSSGFDRVEKQFQEYPSLIYDGPFSEHIEKLNPTMTENKKVVTSEQALAEAKKLLGSRGENLRNDGESQNTALESYLFRADGENESVYAAFTKRGGYPLYFLINRETGEEKITVDNAISKARGFLSEHGYTSMKDSYYDKANGVATINFAYEQGNVICYSDLIKVKVALDDGEIIGFESNGYLMSHKTRSLETPQLDENAAREKVNKHLTIEGVNLAFIPKDSKREVLCYEFRGKYRDKNFLIYINAQNGREEQILMLIETEDGILTV